MRFLIYIFIFFTFSFSAIMQIDSTLIRDSKKALRWSFIPVASQGQIYNKKYLKSFLFIAGQSYSLNRVYYYNQLDDNLDNIKRRNKNTWWFLGIYFASIIDSYIDAELSPFPERNN